MRWSRSVIPLMLRPATENDEARQAREAWKLLTQLPQFLNLWQERGTPYFEVAADWMQQYVCRTSLQLVDIFTQVRKAVEQLRPRAVIAEVMGVATTKAIVLAARQAGIPVLVYRHGSSLGYLTMETGVAPEEYRNDVLFADKLLCWGEADATFFRRWCGVDAVPVGSAHLDSLRQIQRTDAWERRRQRVHHS